MDTTEQEVVPEVRMLTAEESWANFDDLARQHLEMSGEEFLQRLDDGEFNEIVDDPADHQWVVYLAALSSSVR